jgi:hypothetical protein
VSLALIALLRDDDRSRGTMGRAAGQSDFARRTFRYERGWGLGGGLVPARLSVPPDPNRLPLVEVLASASRCTGCLLLLGVPR